MINTNDRTIMVKELYSHMVGKTIKDIDETSCNCLNFEFTDGSELMLEVESVGNGLYTNVGYIKSEIDLL